MTHSGPSHTLIAVLVVLLTCATAGAFSEVPPRSAGGQALVIPERHLEAGEVYHVTAGMGTQLIWHSDAPLMRLVAVCNRVVGYVVTPFDTEEGQAPLLAGAFRIPVASFSTGSQQYDAEFHGERALNAGKYPEITLRITRVSDSKCTKQENGRESYSLKVAGELQVKDKTVAVEIPMRLTLVPFTWQTMMRLGMGDALILRGEFDVPVAEMGLERSSPRSSDYASDIVHFDLYLLCNTMSPERNLYPDITHERYLKQMQFVTLLRDFDDADKGYEFGRTYLREIWDDAQALNRLASATLTEDGIKTRDLGFALKAAQRANELTEFKDPALLDTLARVYYDKGDLATAVKWARQATEHPEGAAAQVVAQARATLERYETQARKSQD